MSQIQTLKIDSDTVHVWFMRSDQFLSAKTAKHYAQMLSVEEKEQYLRYTQPEHRQEYLLSHVLMRTTIARYVDIEPENLQFLNNAYGKPTVLGSGELDLRFNLSHTGGMAVCAVSSVTNIGVDVERHNDSAGLLDMADHYFSEAEVQYLLALPESERMRAFFSSWTLKEAYIKAKGSGQSESLDSFSFDIARLPGEIGFQSEKEPDGGSWDFRLFHWLENFTIALAASTPLRSVSVFQAIEGDKFQQLDACA